MAHRTVEVRGNVAASPQAVWSVVADFAADWHPAIAAIRSERDERGSLVRAFTVHGEDTLYRERLGWLSESDRTLGYTLIKGIEGARAYDAHISVIEGDSGGCVVEWTATVEADEPRLSAICEGTKAVFEMGIEALAKTRRSIARSVPHSKHVALNDMTIDSEPRLALTTSPVKGKMLCLFLHGIGGGRKNWTPQLAASGEIMTAAAVDLRGYGASAVGKAQSTVDDYCADILRIKDEFAADRMVLVGLSYGSWIATSFAMRHPEMLAGLVLSGGCTGMSEASPEEREAFRVSREVPLNAGQTPADFAPAVVNVIAGPDASGEIRAQLLESMASIPAATYRDALVCFTNPRERFDFSQLTMPVLMMTGEHDRLAPPDEIRSVAERIYRQASNADVRFEVVANAGHVCNVEQPDAYNRVLLEFLARLPQ